jgi:hypothetical protein
MTMRAIVGLVLCAATAYIVLCVGGAHIKVGPAAAIELQREQQPERVIPPQRTPPSQVKPYVTTPKTVTPPRTPAEVTVPEHSAPTAPTLSGPKFVVPNGPGMNSAPGGGGKMITAPDTTNPNAAGASKTLQSFTPHGANASVVTMSRVRNLPAMGVSRVAIGGQDYSMWRHSYRARYHDRVYTCVALSALPAILIAANEFYPFGYIEAPESYCDGLSEDGCQLVWQDVETEEGGVIPQCVAYCPWQQ